MSTYNITNSSTANTANTTTLTISFGSPAQNPEIVKDCKAALAALELKGGKLVLLNGPASLPVACVLAHALSHIFGAMGVFDPKMGGYIVAVSHDPELNVGDFIPLS